MKIVVISPSVRSLYTQALIHLLVRDGHQVVGVIVRRMLNWKRFRTEWKQGPSRLVVKVVRRGLHISLLSSPGQERGELDDYHRAIGFEPQGLRAQCRSIGASLYECLDLAEPGVAARMREQRPDIVFFTGGGMVRRPLLDAAGAGVVNCHLGWLPFFRGMDVIEWPALLRKPCALTCHLMDEGLDTGPILLRREIPTHPDDTFLAIRQRVEPLMLSLMRDVAHEWAAGTLTPMKQELAAGRQFFAMHPRLMAIAERQLAQSTNAAEPPPR